MSDTFAVLKGQIAALYITDGGKSVCSGLRASVEANGIDPIRLDLLGNETWDILMGMHTNDEDGGQCFGCLIGDDLVFGRSNVLQLVQGDDVWIVAEKKEANTYLAAAIFRHRDGLVWMHATARGRGAELARIAKLWLAQAALLLVAVGLLALGGIVRRETLAMVIATDVIVTLGLGVLLVPGSIRSARMTECILKRLGFADTYWIDLTPFQERSPGENVFDLKKALAGTQR